MFDPRVEVNHYENTVSRYEQLPIETGKIVFYGDSSFTRWSTKWERRPLEEDILGKDGSPAALNRGIGGSTAEHLLYYYHRVIKPLKPRVLVLQEFGNDRTAGYSPAEILFLLSRVIAYARQDFPGIRFYCCDVRPLAKHINQKSWKNQVEEFNELLKTYCDKHEDCTFVCHTDSPLFFNDPADVGDYSKIRTDIFIEDQVHYNQAGYDLYKEFFLQVLDDIL